MTALEDGNALHDGLKSCIRKLDNWVYTPVNDNSFQCSGKISWADIDCLEKTLDHFGANKLQCVVGG